MKRIVFKPVAPVALAAAFQSPTASANNSENIGGVHFPTDVVQIKENAYSHNEASVFIV